MRNGDNPYVYLFLKALYFQIDIFFNIRLPLSATNFQPAGSRRAFFVPAPDGCPLSRKTWSEKSNSRQASVSAAARRPVPLSSAHRASPLPAPPSLLFPSPALSAPNALPGLACATHSLPGLHTVPGEGRVWDSHGPESSGLRPDIGKNPQFGSSEADGKK